MNLNNFKSAIFIDVLKMILTSLKLSLYVLPYRKHSLWNGCVLKLKSKSENNDKRRAKKN